MKRTNASYEIINSITLRGYEIVLGRGLINPNCYVTWLCSNGNDYYWGHYFQDEVAAIKDFGKRIMDEADAPWF